MRIPSTGMRIPDPIVGSGRHGRLSTQRGASMQDGSRALGRPRTPSRYHTRLSKRYTTHHGSTGFPPGTTGEPSRYAGEEQGERDSESVKATSDPVGTSRIEEANGTTPFEKETFEQGHPSNRSKGKSNIETEYREHVNSGFSEYTNDYASRVHSSNEARPRGNYTRGSHQSRKNELPDGSVLQQ